MKQLSKTTLYKSLKEKLGKDADWKDISKQLGIAYKSELEYHRDFNQSDISCAFIWIVSPQGHKFWSDIAYRYYKV